MCNFHQKGMGGAILINFKVGGKFSSLNIYIKRKINHGPGKRVINGQLKSFHENFKLHTVVKAN